MKKLFKRFLFRIRKLLGLEIILILLGKQMKDVHRNMNDIEPLDKFEFKVFSQWGEDGIIQFLINSLEIPNKVFIEFGVEDYTEANTRFLLMNDNWSGLVMDLSKSNINYIKKDDIYWKYDLKAVRAFITKDNINELIHQNINEKDIGLLVIDIDGNDYWVWKAINTVSPRIVVCEYNAVFGCERFITVPYDEKFIRTKKHYSNLYFGASLPALCLLAEEKGYVFVGCNSNGNEAFFIRKDICRFKSVNYKEGFVNSKSRESRNCKHQLTYIRDGERNKVILDMEVFDLKLNKKILIKDVF